MDMLNMLWCMLSKPLHSSLCCSIRVVGVDLSTNVRPNHVTTWPAPFYWFMVSNGPLPRCISIRVPDLPLDKKLARLDQNMHDHYGSNGPPSIMVVWFNQEINRPWASMSSENTCSWRDNRAKPFFKRALLVRSRQSVQFAQRSIGSITPRWGGKKLVIPLEQAASLCFLHQQMQRLIHTHVCKG